MSLITAKHFFGAKYDTMAEELRSFAEEHWPDVGGVKCKKCDKELYCSTKCKNEAWKRYHQIICPSVNPAAEELYELINNRGRIQDEKGQWRDVWVAQYSPMILAKIWASIIAEAKRLMAQRGVEKPDTEIWAYAKMPFRK